MTSETTDQRTSIVAKEDKVPIFQKFIYGVAGPIDILSVWVLVSIAYNVFNMELKMSFNQVAIILMSLRLWDAVADPVMGWISDNTRTRWGRRRPWILIGGVLSGLTYPLIWWFPRDLSQTQIMMWVIGFGIIFYTCFTIWAMPYQSLLMEMTPDYNERTRVASIRSIFQTIFSLINGFAWYLSMLPIFHVDGHPSPINGMRYISIAIAALIFFLGPLPAFFVKERYYEHDLTRKQPKINLFKSLSETLACKPFLILCVFTVFFLLGCSVFDGYGRYVGTYYVLGGDWGIASLFVGWGTIIYTATSLIMIQVFRFLSERIGKNKCMFISMGLVLFSAAITWWTNNPAHPWWMLINSFFVGAGYAGLWLMIPSMQADVVDYDELHTQERREGSFASVFSWVLKLSFCAGFMASGPLLTMTGFNGGEFERVKTAKIAIENCQKAISDGGDAKASQAVAALEQDIYKDTGKALQDIHALESSAILSSIKDKDDAKRFSDALVSLKGILLANYGAVSSIADNSDKLAESAEKAGDKKTAASLKAAAEKLKSAFPKDKEGIASALTAISAATAKIGAAGADEDTTLETIKKSIADLEKAVAAPAFPKLANPPAKTKVDESLTNMRIGYIALPVVAAIIAILIFAFFPLTSEKMAEIRKQLEERRGKV